MDNLWVVAIGSFLLSFVASYWLSQFQLFRNVKARNERDEYAKIARAYAVEVDSLRLRLGNAEKNVSDLDGFLAIMGINAGALSDSDAHYWTRLACGLIRCRIDENAIDASLDLKQISAILATARAIVRVPENEAAVELSIDQRADQLSKAFELLGVCGFKMAYAPIHTSDLNADSVQMVLLMLGLKDSEINRNLPSVTRAARVLFENCGRVA